MAASERELEQYGDRFIMSFEAIRRALSLYPPSHPKVGEQLGRFLDNLAELRERTGQATVNLAKGEFFVNGVALKKLSITYQKAISSWEEKGVGLIAFGPEMDAGSVLRFFHALGRSRDEIVASGGVGKLLADAGVQGIRAARVTIGVEADAATVLDGEPAGSDVDAPPLDDPDAARARYRDRLGRLLHAIQGAAAVDPRVRMVRNLSQLIESRLLERAVVRRLAAELRQHDKESYRHALGGAVVSVLVGSALGLQPARLRLLGEAALLRDIGKLALPADLHDGERDESRRAEYRRHPLLGARMLLERWEIDPTAAIVAHEHHARLDLKGFPALRVKGSLHAFTRVVAVASEYDRMTGGYPGEPARSIAEAVSQLIQGVGTAYDPAAVRGFLQVMGCVPEGTPVQLLDGREGIVAGPGRRSWLAPEVAVLRDAAGAEPAPAVVATDGLAPPGESVVHSFFTLGERDRERLEALRDVE